MGTNGDNAGSEPPTSPTATVRTAGVPPSPQTTTEATEKTKNVDQEIPGDGTFLVGREVRPGTYRGAGPAEGGSPCYWARLKGTTGADGETVANGAGKGQATVTVLDTDKAFQTTGCQTWKRLG
ncbi:hypothetical protein [Streptomyces litmocidini]|uniref:hypothetical protein n=1 Tax=Streptomyces litmocidini TaxID=67318 RepID=UPI003700EF57